MSCAIVEQTNTNASDHRVHRDHRGQRLTSIQIRNRLIPWVNCRTLKLINSPTGQLANLRLREKLRLIDWSNPGPGVRQTSMAAPMILAVIWSNSSSLTMFPSLGLFPCSSFSRVLCVLCG